MSWLSPPPPRGDLPLWSLPSPAISTLKLQVSWLLPFGLRYCLS